MSKYRKNTTAAFSLKFHLVWCPKYRRKVLDDQIAARLKTLLCQKAIELNIQIHALEIMPDHVHIFVEIPPTMSVSKALQLFKGISSYKLFKQHPWLRKHFRRGHFWSPGKFFRSVGNVTAETIQHYISESQGAWNFQPQRKVTSFA